MKLIISLSFHPSTIHHVLRYVEYNAAVERRVIGNDKNYIKNDKLKLKDLFAYECICKDGRLETTLLLGRFLFKIDR